MFFLRMFLPLAIIAGVLLVPESYAVRVNHLSEKNFLRTESGKFIPSLSQMKDKLREKAAKAKAHLSKARQRLSDKAAQIHKAMKKTAIRVKKRAKHHLSRLSKMMNIFPGQDKAGSPVVLDVLKHPEASGAPIALKLLNAKREKKGLPAIKLQKIVSATVLGSIQETTYAMCMEGSVGDENPFHFALELIVGEPNRLHHVRPRNMLDPEAKAVQFICESKIAPPPLPEPKKKSASSQNRFADAASRVNSLLPRKFDSRKQWPQCAQIISEPSNQGSCGSCFAFAALRVAASRLCIAGKTGFGLALSVQHSLSCSAHKQSSTCHRKDGSVERSYVDPSGACNGGRPGSIFEFARDHGLMAAECQDYAYGHDHELGTCEITPLADNVKLKCIGVASVTLPKKDQTYTLDSIDLCECESKGEGYDRVELEKNARFTPCVQSRDPKCFANGDPKVYKMFRPSTAETVEEIKQAILKDGPVTGSMALYSDFQPLEWDKVYQRADEFYNEAAMASMSFEDQQTCREKGTECALFLGLHAMTLIGWGTQDGVPYWLAINSWGAGWPRANKAGRPPKSPGFVKIAQDLLVDTAKFAYATDPKIEEREQGGWCDESLRAPGAEPKCLSLTQGNNQCVIKNKCDKVFKFAVSDVLYDVAGRGATGECSVNWWTVILKRGELVLDSVVDCCIREENEDTSIMDGWDSWDTCLKAKKRNIACGHTAAREAVKERVDRFWCKITKNKNSRGQCTLRNTCDEAVDLYVSKTSLLNTAPGEMRYFGPYYDHLCDDPSYGRCWIDKGCLATNQCDYAVKVASKQDIGTPDQMYFPLSPGATFNGKMRCADLVVKKKKT